MKELRGTATGVVAGSVEDCIEFLAAVEDYPTWHPDVVRTVQVISHDDQGRATQARTDLHISYGPLVKSFHLLLAVRVDPAKAVRLTRIPHDASDREKFAVAWRVEPDDAGTRITLEVDANLSVPRLLPLGGVGDALAEGFVAAAGDALSSRWRRL